MSNSLDDFTQCLMKFEIAVSNKSHEQINLFNQLVGMFKERSLDNSWISVDDELPKNQQEVLVCNINSKHFNRVRTAIFEKNAPNSGFLVNGWLDEPKGKITHWQPLPQPPKE